VLSLKALRSRTGLAAGATLVLVAAAAVLFVLLSDRTARIAAAAAIWAGAVLLLVPLALRARRTELARRDELDRKEARYKALLDGLPLVTWLTEPDDPDTTHYVSSSVEDLTGYSPAEWSEQPGLYSKLLHPEDRERVLKELEPAAEGTPVRTDYRLLRRDGRVVWVRQETAIVRDPGGEPLYTQTFLRDIAELKRSEAERERLQAEEQAAASKVGERQSRLDLVRHAGHELASTLDPCAALTRVADLTVREFADWCVVDVLGAADELSRVAVARAEPSKVDGKGGLDQEPGDEIRAVAQSGRARLLPAPDDDSRDELVRFLNGVEARSVICVPLRARNQPLGALTVARTERGQAYSAGDVAVVEDLAARIGLALDRERLYREVEERADAGRVVEHRGDAIMLLARNGIIRHWNPAADANT
jgi:PAS domain S-box-containing protein